MEFNKTCGKEFRLLITIFYLTDSDWAMISGKYLQMKYVGQMKKDEKTQVREKTLESDIRL